MDRGVCYTLSNLKLRTRFATLAAVTLVPWLALAVGVVLLAMRDRHASIEHGLQERAVILVALTGYGQPPHLVKPIEPRRLEQVLTREHSEGRRFDATEVTSGKPGDRR